MTELLTAAQMRAIEEAAIASGEVSGLELMERAGRGVVAAVFEEWPELAKAPHRALVLCGPGNNGGDGFVVARLLKEWGWEVEVFLYGDPEKLPQDARANYERWREKGEVCTLGFPGIESGPFQRLSDAVASGGLDDPDPGAASLVIDALFGIGLNRPADGIMPLFELSEFGRGNVPTRWVALDVPSGMCADSGRLFRAPLEQQTPHAVIGADLTVTFHRRKSGHHLSRGPVWCGRVRVADIGLPDDPAPTLPSWRGCAPVHEAQPDVLLLQKHGDAQKFSHGHALILAGGAGRTGAARLAARGALRIGAGLVTLGAPGNAFQEVACQITALMLKRVDDPAALANVLEDARIDALCLGPGLGLDRARELVPAALGAGRATVLDADALTAFADDPASLFAMLHENCVLTPHAGEFARLFPDLGSKLNEPPIEGPAYSKIDATREASARAGCVVLFKGPDTVIAAPDGRCSVNSAQYDREAPWLATAGSGDVLAGFITGLIARGFGPMRAAETAAWLHVESALRFGPGLIAEDLPEILPEVLRGLSV
ncbi:MAG: NAD(P)H-hydrate dehydratase [Roseovarius sp.]